MVAGLVEVVSAFQGRMTGLALWIMGVIQVRDDADADADAEPDGGPDVMGIGMFWIPEKDGCSSSPFEFSNAAELEPEG
jgi:hypothetical protein